MMQDRQIWSSFYYLIISVKDIGTSNVVYVGFSPDEQNIPLLFPVGAIELEAPSQYYHTTDDIYVKTDTGTATINIWGVLF
jgi:hypothetical protein